MQTPLLLQYREQHKQRLSYMPWLYFQLKAKHREWAKPWQEEWQAYLQAVETVEIKGDCFISPDAKLFAEPGRTIIIDEGSFIAANSVLHGPIRIGKHVGINHHCSLDGGSAGIRIGDHCRIAAYSHLYAFNHGTRQDQLIRNQATRSNGITLGKDVWLGAHTGVTDGVFIGDGAVIGMQSVVTKNIPANTKAAGNPAKVIAAR